LSYTDQKATVPDKVAALKKTTPTDKTDPILIEELREKSARQLINYIQCPENSEEEQVAAVKLYEKHIIRGHNTNQLKHSFNNLADFAPELGDIFRRFASNDSFMERAANYDLTQEDLELIENSFRGLMHESMKRAVNDDLTQEDLEDNLINQLILEILIAKKYQK